MKQEIFLEVLPRYIEGRYKGKINWLESIGCKVEFIYDNIEGWIEIENYIPKEQQLIIKYKDKEFNIRTNGIVRCQLGKILGKRTSEFKIEIKKIFKDNKRNIIIVDREYRNNHDKKEKWYKYHCVKCGYEGWIIESSLLDGSGCACCCPNPHVVVKGINDIATTHPHLIKYFKNIEDAYTHTYASHKKVWIICPDCGFEKEMKISNIQINGISCPQCSDGSKFPERAMLNILTQLDLNFQTQLSKATFNWCDKYRYDFYFKHNNVQYVIETHGMQHYKDCTWSKAKDVQENDKLKKELAISNGIKEENYIVIDCRKSTLEWIKDNKNGILNSKLNELFDLNKIDWVKCYEFTATSSMKEAWELKKNNDRLTTSQIGDILGLNPHTISDYLDIGDKLNYCNYRKGKEGTPIAIYKDRVLIGLFKDAQELEDSSEYVLGYKLLTNGIFLSKNKGIEYKGFTFKNVDIKYEECKGFEFNNSIDVKYKSPFAKSVICVDTGIEYVQINIASKEYNTTSSNIIACCKGKRNFVKKVRWLYLEDYNYMIKNNYSYEYIKKYIKEKYSKEEIN